MSLGGFLGGLSNLIEKLNELAEKGEELHQTGELGSPEGKVRGVYGFTIRTGLGRGGEGIKVEPFGNVRKDARTGRPVVREVSEPIADVFDEADHVLVVVELPGIAAEDVRLELREDLLVIDAQRGSKKYHKEERLPCAPPLEKMTCTCNNGVLEVRLGK
jgi:HSP20 family protein